MRNVSCRTLPRTSPAMLSPEEIARIKADIKRLDKAREECADSGIRKLIEAWIGDQKKKLEQP
jgi:hypothetical protein